MRYIPAFTSFCEDGASSCEIERAIPRFGNVLGPFCNIRGKGAEVLYVRDLRNTKISRFCGEVRRNVMAEPTSDEQSAYSSNKADKIHSLGTMFAYGPISYSPAQVEFVPHFPESSALICTSLSLLLLFGHPLTRGPI